MKIEQWKTGDIIPYENNPRHNDGAVEKVAMSLQQYGWQQPIVVDGDGVIIAGHTRWKAARSIGMETCPVVVAENLTPAQVKAYRIADNRTGELAEWDKDLLDLEIQELVDLDFDVELTGFSLADLGLEDDPEPKEEPPEREEVEENFLVVVECKTEQEQIELLERFQGEGLQCKALIS